MLSYMWDIHWKSIPFTHTSITGHSKNFDERIRKNLRARFNLMSALTSISWFPRQLGPQTEPFPMMSGQRCMSLYRSTKYVDVKEKKMTTAVSQHRRPEFLNSPAALESQFLIQSTYIDLLTIRRHNVCLPQLRLRRRHSNKHWRQRSPSPVFCTYASLIRSFFCTRS